MAGVGLKTNAIYSDLMACQVGEVWSCSEEQPVSYTHSVVTWASVKMF